MLLYILMILQSVWSSNIKCDSNSQNPAVLKIFNKDTANSKSVVIYDLLNCHSSPSTHYMIFVLMHTETDRWSNLYIFGKYWKDKMWYYTIFIKTSYNCEDHVCVVIIS